MAEERNSVKADAELWRCRVCGWLFFDSDAVYGSDEDHESCSGTSEKPHMTVSLERIPVHFHESVLPLVEALRKICAKTSVAGDLYPIADMALRRFYQDSPDPDTSENES